MRTTRLVRYAEDNRTLYLNIYERKDRDPAVKAPVFVYIHGGGWIGGLPEPARRSTRASRKRDTSW